MSEEKSLELSENKNPKEKRIDIRERVALTSDSVDRLNAWVDQLKAKRRGVSLNRKGLVNWLIATHAAELSSAEEEALGREFFDEMKFLEQVMDDMRRAKAEGRSVTLEECMAASHGGPRPSKRLAIARKAKLKLDTDAPSS